MICYFSNKNTDINIVFLLTINRHEASKDAPTTGNWVKTVLGDYSVHAVEWKGKRLGRREWLWLMASKGFSPHRHLHSKACEIVANWFGPGHNSRGLPVKFRAANFASHFFVKTSPSHREGIHSHLLIRGQVVQYLHSEILWLHLIAFFNPISLDNAVHFTWIFLPTLTMKNILSRSGLFPSPHTAGTLVRLHPPRTLWALHPVFL